MLQVLVVPQDLCFAFGRALLQALCSGQIVLMNLMFCRQLPSDATRPLEEEEFSPQVRDVSSNLKACHLYLKCSYDSVTFFPPLIYFQGCHHLKRKTHAKV